MRTDNTGTKLTETILMTPASIQTIKTKHRNKVIERIFLLKQLS